MPDTPPLADLAPLLRDDAAVRAVVARAPRPIAVPASARALFVAALAGVSTRRPILVAVPTRRRGRAAGPRPAALPRPGDRRVSPPGRRCPSSACRPRVETMGRRLRVLWRLRDAAVTSGRLPVVVVAPVAPSCSASGRTSRTLEPVAVRTGETWTATSWWSGSSRSATGASTRSKHRGEVAVRGSIVDVYPSPTTTGARRPVGRRGRPAHCVLGRPTSAPHPTTSTMSMFRCREVLPTDEVREPRRPRWCASPWGREQWDASPRVRCSTAWSRGCPGSTAEEHLLPDLLPRRPVILVEPRRIRDRAEELLDEEAALASALAQTWGARSRRCAAAPRCRSNACSPHTEAGATCGSSPTPEGPGHRRASPRPACDPVAGDTDALMRRLRALAADGYRVVLAPRARASADRTGRDYSPSDGSTATAAGHTPAHPTRGQRRAAPRTRRSCSPSRSSRSSPRPTSPGAAGAPPAPAARPSTAFFDDARTRRLRRAPPARGRPATAAWSAGHRRRRRATTCCSSTSGGDKLYVPTDQVESCAATRGETPSLNRMGGADWERAGRGASRRPGDRPGAGRALPRASTARPRLRPGHPWQRESRRRSPSTRPPTSSRPSRT